MDVVDVSVSAGLEEEEPPVLNHALFVSQSTSTTIAATIVRPTTTEMAILRLFVPNVAVGDIV